MKHRSSLVNGLLLFAAFSLACPAFVGFTGLRQMSLHDARVVCYFLCLLVPFFVLLLFRNLRLVLAVFAIASLSAWAIQARISLLNCRTGDWSEPYTVPDVIFGCLKDPCTGMLIFTSHSLRADRMVAGAPPADTGRKLTCAFSFWDRARPASW